MNGKVLSHEALTSEGDILVQWFVFNLFPSMSVFSRSILG